MERPRVVLGLAGGSGSGKSRLAALLADAFPGRAALICHDWWYRHQGELSREEELKLNFDHPESLETPLMCRQLDALLAGEAIDAPVYDYAAHARLSATRRIEPRPLLIIDGILILHEAELRRRMTASVFIAAPDDVRLARRVRRDCRERRVDVEETLRLYEETVRPMHEEFVAPSSRHATWVWSQLEDPAFPDRLVRDLVRRLAAPEAPALAPAPSRA